MILSHLNLSNPPNWPRVPTFRNRFQLAGCCFKIRLQLTRPISTNKKPPFIVVWSIIRSDLTRSREISTRSRRFQPDPTIFQPNFDWILAKSSEFYPNLLLPHSIETDRRPTRTWPIQPESFTDWWRVWKLHTWFG